MKKFKGTPGEWKLNTPRSGESLIYSENNEGLKGNIVCEAPIEFKESMQYWPANAALICAAPEMLDVLKEAKLQIEYLHKKFGETGSGNSVISRIETVIEKAINIQP